MTVGVVAIQGDFECHKQAFRACDRHGLQVVEVRTPEDLARVERVVLPGGESTTVGLLMRRFGLGAALQQAAAEGMPIWGTCMGMILMAREVEERPNQYCLGLLDIRVRRNAFGAQVHSFEGPVQVSSIEAPITGVFIRAPVVTETGPQVEELARYSGQIVGVRQGNRLGTSFHPELTEDRRLHQWFLDI